MKRIVEDGIEAGTWNKYESRNPIQRWLVRRFLDTLRSVAGAVSAECADALDVGCGEGVTTRLLAGAGFQHVKGIDFSAAILEVARRANPDLPFEQLSIYDLDARYESDFVAACEVMEHLHDPLLGFGRLASVCRKWCMISVPREPIFRGLNFCAGKYWSDFGNSPGHLNHWSARDIRELVSGYFEIVHVRRPLPWTVILARKRKQHRRLAPESR